MPEFGAIRPESDARLLVIGGTGEQQQAIRELYPASRFLVLRHDIAEIAAQLDALGTVDHIVWIAPDHPSSSPLDESRPDRPGNLPYAELIGDQDVGVLQLFRLVKALLSRDYAARELGWTLITADTLAVHGQDAVRASHAGVHGLVGSMAKEYAHWPVRLLDLEAAEPWPWRELFALPPDSRGDAWGYRRGEWFRQELVPVHEWPPDTPNLYRAGGVYVVIGGAGGIGNAWSRFMIREHGARLVWIGRRAEDDAVRTVLDALGTVGPRPLYFQADARDRSALRAIYERVKTSYGHVHGVVHSAIVLLDQTLAKMDEDRFRAGLSAKVDVSVRLAEVFADEPLDFVLFFSAVQSFLKAPGQGNYASGCTFLDAFAHQLRRDLPCPVKIINWGYWGSIGVVKDAFYRERMAAAGIGSIEPEDGMAALHTLLNGPLHQLALVKTLAPEVVQAMEPVNLDAWVTAYPGASPVDLQALRAYLPGHYPQLERIKAEGVPQREGMDELLVRLLWGSLQSMGLFRGGQTVADGAGPWRTAAGLSDVYERWFAETVRLLGLAGYLRCDRERLTVNDSAPVDLEVLWREWDEYKQPWLADPDRKAPVVLVEHCLRALPEILTGKRQATDVMFPDASMELVEGIYKGNVVADYFNEVLGDTAVAYVRERLARDAAPGGLRILEIGAGTGGTTATVLPKLDLHRGHIREYCYTDISRAFLLHAQREYAPGHSFLTTKLFDVEHPVAAQGIEASGYDLVIATNVLHATRNIRRTLANAKAALRRGGLLLLNELNGSALFVHLTFGLLEGWWRYEDAALRLPGCPGLAPETWARVLKEEGFPAVLFPAEESHGLGQHIIVAQSDGVVRQARGARREHHPSLSPGKGGGKPGVLPAHRRLDTPARAKGRDMTPTGATERGRHPDAITSRRRRHSRKRNTGVRSSATPSPASVRDIADEALRDKSTALLKKLVADTLNMAPRQIESSASLEAYGIDSILVIRLTNAFRQVFDRVSSTLFFEVQTVDALVDHFMATQRDTLIRLAGAEGAPDVAIPGDPAAAATRPVNNSSTVGQRPRGFDATRRFTRTDTRTRDERPAGAARTPDRPVFAVRDVAVIGLSGRYPGAANVGEFWQRLRAGTNCVGEIPPDRWDWRRFYDDGEGESRQELQPLGRIPRRHRQVRSALLPHLAPRGRGHGPAGAPVPRNRLRLHRGRRLHARHPLRPAGKVGVFVGVMHGTLLPSAQPLVHRQPRFLPVRFPRPQPGGRLRLLGLADRHPPRPGKPIRRHQRLRRRRRGQPHPQPRPVPHPRRHVRALRRRDVPRVRRAAPTASWPARAWAPCC